MFIEDNDWNDGTDAQTSQAVLNKTLKSSGKNKLKSKSVGKKSLLRTLQTLGTPQHLKSDDTHKESDSEAESAPPRPKKRKKKRNRGRKKTDESGKDSETPGVDKDKNEHNGPKRLNKRDIQLGSSKLKKPDLGKRESKVRPDTSTEKEDADKLSRKQWKVKMKNKRKCKNKYRQSESELDINKTDTAPQNETMEQLNVDFHSGNSNETVQTPSHNKAKKKDHKPPKRKRMETGDGVVNTPDIQRLKLNKRPIKDQVKENNHAKQNVPSSSHGSSRETGESLDAVKEDSPHPTPSKRQKIQMIKEMSRKRERLRKLLQAADGPEHPAEGEAEADVAKHPEEEEVERPPAVDRSASLRSRMEQRLEAARFRYINEVLYTTSSGEAKRMFTQDPQAFGIYHKGFTAQVQRWPTNPVDAIISYIQHKPPSKVVADFGCGDCKIARSVKNKVHCFDLAPICDLVTVCDMANVPLKDNSVHIAVFCLSLMGTNLVDFLVEANRVLVMGGVLKIAEVASRFDDVRGFLTTLTNLGFKMVTKDTENSHFYAFEFLKTKDVSENVKSSRLQLRPCVYKKR